ncbi:myoglobin-like [Gigantopelta aegis]|uniref:myoglobin-like n=1 Tax=Gigantopelta aegis TaxID=1735272 RepID=UPI001B88765A|nr:myoglobin-like [Gigantopelta aegis]
MDKQIKLEDYGVNATTGFLMDDVVADLPDYFEPWNRLSHDMVKLTEAGQMRDEILKMPVLDHSKLSSDGQLWRAHQIMAALTSGYLWQNGPRDVPKCIPRQIAVPWTEVSKRLGTRAGLSYVDLTLANWRLLDTDKPPSMGNIEDIQRFPGGETWSSFIKCNILVEFAFAKAVEPLENVLRCFDEADEVGITTHLEELTAALDGFIAQQKDYHKYMNPDDFFLKLIPYFASVNEVSGSPEGIIYEGVSEEPIRMMNASAAQTPGIKVVDALLGIKPQSQRQPHQYEFRDYMVPSHVQLIKDVTEKNFKDMVKKSTNENLKQAFKTCVDTVIKFRSYHVQLVTKYVVIPANKATKGNPEASKAASEGNVHLLSFLKGMRDDTKETSLE